MTGSRNNSAASAALVAALCSALAGCAGTAADIRTPVFSVEVERAQDAAANTAGETAEAQPQPPPAPTDQSISTATAQDNAVTYNISNVQGDVIIGPDTRQPEEQEASDTADLPGAGLADPLRANICRFEGLTPEAYHDGAAWHIACGHKLDDEEMAALRDEDIERAETEARRLLGARLDAMPAPRRDALIWLCFAASCAGFGDVLAAVRSDPPDWSTAAAEVTDSEFRSDPRFPGRSLVADCIASWLRSGEYLEC